MKKRYGGMAGVKPIYQVVGGGGGGGGPPPFWGGGGGGGGGDPPVPLHLGKPWLVLYFH